MIIEADIEISKPIDKVFTYTTNSAHAFVWRSTLIAVTSIPQEAMRVGSTFQERSKLLDQVIETTYEVIEWIPPRRFTYKSIVGAVRGLVCLRFAPTSGGTQVKMRIEQAFDLVFPHAEPLAVHAVQRILQTDLQTLKETLESS